MQKLQFPDGVLPAAQDDVVTSRVNDVAEPDDTKQI